MNFTEKIKIIKIWTLKLFRNEIEMWGYISASEKCLIMGTPNPLPLYYPLL